MLARRLYFLQVLVFQFLASVSQLRLRPSSELDSNCYNFPDENYDRTSCIRCKYVDSPKILINAGERAIDFTLHTLEGKSWTLSDALKQNKPVCLIWGMFTCPAFQGMGTSYPWEACAYWHEASLISSYHDRVTFVHLVAAEPHPMPPGTNFDDGTIRINFWSVVSQARTYEDRLNMTRKIVSMVHPLSYLLADYLPDNPYFPGLSQPVWCTYAQGARTATVIGTDGIVKYTQDWFNANDMATALDSIIEDNAIVLL